MAKKPIENQEIKETESTGIISHEIRVRLTTIEEMLGTASANPEIHEEFIASKAPKAELTEQEVAAIEKAVDPEQEFEKAKTIFPMRDGKPFMYDYQFKGFCKDTCAALRKVKGSLSSKITAYKKDIDGLIFPMQREIPIQFNGEIGTCQRPLRAQTAQGERIALASSDSIPAGAVLEFSIMYFETAKVDLGAVIREWLNYGRLRGLGQWRNSGKGRFVWDELGENGNVIGGNNSFKATA